MTPPAEQESICTYLEWDSKFFQLPIARLNRTRLDHSTVTNALQWCNTNRIECLYFLCDSDDPQTTYLAEANGFHLTDVRVVFEQSLAQNEVVAAPSGAIRFARESDLGLLRTLASAAHHDTRFYFDKNFDRAKCDLLYETWIENSCRGFAQAVLVAEVDHQPAAYLTCHLKQNESQVGLVGVGESHQGQGLGTKLVQNFLAWSHGQGARRATVATQGRNLAAQRLYQRNGFVTASVQLWYHRWFHR